MAKFSSGPNRATQIDDMWQLVQQNDYLMGTVFAAQEIFPEVYGSCGPLFVVEHLNPLIRESTRGLMGLSDWKSRIKAAVLILDYLKELEANTQDPIKLCNVKFSNFGISGNKYGHQLSLVACIAIYNIHVLFALPQINEIQRFEIGVCRIVLGYNDRQRQSVSSRLTLQCAAMQKCV